MTDGSGTVTYSYDVLNRLTGVTRGTDTFSYGYDAANNITNRTYPDNTSITYTYDEDNRLASVASGGSTTSYAYDAASDPITTTLPASNGYTETRTYDKAGRLTEVKNANASSTLSDFTSTLDAVGNPTTVVQTGAVTGTTTYGYDANDRLTSVCYQASCPGQNDPYIRWTYDQVGNRLTETRPSGTTNYTYNTADELTAAGNTTYGYDHNGNETSAGSTSYNYDLADRLSSTTNGGTTTSYSYDGDGNRLQASTGSQPSQKTNYLWDALDSTAQLALERDGNNALLRRYVYGIRRISMSTGASTYYFAHDGLGSVVNVTTSAGTVEWSYTYEPFGVTKLETQNDPSAPTNVMKFAGELADATGLYDLRARDYDPHSARFLQRDPIAPVENASDGSSTYVYANNRPGVLIDPTGMTFEPSDDAEVTTRSLASAVGTSRFAGPPWFCGLFQSDPYYVEADHAVQAFGYLQCSGPRAAQLYLTLEVCVGRKIRRRFWFDTWQINCDNNPRGFVHKRFLQVTGHLLCKSGTHEYQGVATGHVNDPGYSLGERFTIGPVRSIHELTKITC